MWRMLRVGRILICVYTTNKDCLLLLLLLLLLLVGKHGAAVCTLQVQEQDLDHAMENA